MEILKNHIIVLQAIPESGRKMKITGTGFLLQLYNRHFIITAAHVLDKFYPEKRFIVPRGIGLEERSRYICRTFVDHPAVDLIDVASIELTCAEANSVQKSGYSFITEKQIEWNHAKNDPNRLIFTGFPTSGLKIRKGTVSPQSYTVAIEPYDSRKIMDMKLSPIQHLAGRFEKRKMKVHGRPELITARDPYGMSGGAVWANTNRHFEPKFRLVGIGIEYRKKENALIAVKCSELGLLLRSKYKDLRDRIPATILSSTRRSLA